MTKPKRIQRKRTKGSRLPPNTVCVTRPGPYGNPALGEGAVCWFKRWLIDPKMTVGDLEELIEKCSCRYGSPPALIIHNADRALTAGEYIARVKRELPGKNLACWCHPSIACHADVLLEIANQ